LEEQVVQYQKFDQEYKATLAAEKAALKKSFEDRSAKELEDVVAAAKAEAVSEAKKGQREALLLISQFLRLAAVRRGDEDADASLEENMALEGVLAKVYTGDQSAVKTMVSLIEGTDERTVSVNSDPLGTTCKRPSSYQVLEHCSQTIVADIKAATLAQPLPGSAVESIEDTDAVETSEHPVQSDPTIANAGLTELDAPPATAVTNGHEEAYDAGVPQNAGVGDGAANAAAEANWDANNDLSTSQEWVEVHRDVTETDTGITATPAAPSNIQSWADESTPDPEVRNFFLLARQLVTIVFEHIYKMLLLLVRIFANRRSIQTSSTPTPPAANPPNDGFHEVQRNRGGNRGDGQGRGRGGRGGGGRGRGFRGGNRGGGGFRGDRGRGRPDES
jgi:hypothetical protein